MTPLDRLLKTLDARGLAVVRGTTPGQLMLSGPAAEKTPAVIEAVKAFKPQLLRLFEQAPTAAPEPPPVVEPATPPPPPPAASEDEWGNLILRAGEAAPAVAATLLGSENGTSAYRRFDLVPGTVYRWEEWRDASGRYPAMFRVWHPAGRVPVPRARMTELFPGVVTVGDA